MTDDDRHPPDGPPEAVAISVAVAVVALAVDAEGGAGVATVRA
ncbi:hypothetical protein [Streptomyces sp. NPDC003697]